VGAKTWPVRAGKIAVMAGGGEHGVDVVAAASSEIVGGYIAGHTVFGLERERLIVRDHYLQCRASFHIAWGCGVT
jgi:uncharacterized protein YsxB (DUF464 family)